MTINYLDYLNSTSAEEAADMLAMERVEAQNAPYDAINKEYTDQVAKAAEAREAAFWREWANSLDFWIFF